MTGTLHRNNAGDSAEAPRIRIVSLGLAIIFLFIVVTGGAYMLLGPDSAAPPASPSAEAAPDPTEGGILEGGQFRTPTTDPFGRRLDVPVNQEGQALPQASGQPLPETDTTTAPRGLSWQLTRYGALPFSTADGPSEAQDCQIEGFAHNPQGAALAGLHLAYRWSFCLGDSYRRFYEASVVRSDANRAYVEERADSRAEYGGIKDSYAPDAFRFTTYDPDFAHVEYAMRRVTQGQTSWVVVPVSMVWQRGRWMLDPSTLNTSPARISAIDSGWTPW